MSQICALAPDERLVTVKGPNSLFVLEVNVAKSTCIYCPLSVSSTFDARGETKKMSVYTVLTQKTSVKSKHNFKDLSALILFCSVEWLSSSFTVEVIFECTTQTWCKRANSLKSHTVALNQHCDETTQIRQWIVRDSQWVISTLVLGCWTKITPLTQLQSEENSAVWNGITQQRTLTMAIVKILFAKVEHEVMKTLLVTRAVWRLSTKKKAVLEIRKKKTLL